MRKRGRTPRAVLGSILLALPLACGSDGNGPMDPGNGDTDIRGSYTAIHELTFAIGTIGLPIECPGSLTITSLNNGQFGGVLSIDDCPEFEIEAESGPISGTVSGNGAVVVDLDEGDMEAFEELFAAIGCVAVRIDEAFTGTFTGNAITVSFSADLECENGTVDATFTYRIEATRIS